MSLAEAWALWATLVVLTEKAQGQDGLRFSAGLTLLQTMVTLERAGVRYGPRIPR